jgi:rod shape-determining protein MreC
MPESKGKHVLSLLTCRPPPIMRLLFFAALSIALIADQRGSNVLSPLRALLLTAVYPLQVAVDLPARGYHWAVDNFGERHKLVEENARLKAHETLLQAQLQRYISLEVEIRDLRELLHAAGQLREKILVTELVSVDMAQFSRHITIDKGANDQVFVGQPVLDTNGVMGQVHYVSPISSTVILITDPDHALPVQVNRNGLRGVLMGTGPSNRLTLSYVPNSADILVGDQLVTSGLGGRFPAGFPVGKVVKVDQDPREPFARVEAEPSAHPERSRRFILLWPEAPASPATEPDADGANGQQVATDKNKSAAAMAVAP